MEGHLKCVYEPPNRTTPKQFTLNRNMLSQTKACIAKSSRANKRGQSMTEVNWQNVIFWDFII